MDLNRIVVGSKTLFFRSGLAYTLPDPGGTASATALPGPTDPAWLDLGPIKWTKSNKSKTEEFMAASPGAYRLTQEVVLSKGLVFKGKLEYTSNLAEQLIQSAATSGGASLPSSPAAGAAYVPLGGSPIIEGWLYIRQYNQHDTLLNTMYVWVSIKASGDLNNDEKAAELPIEAALLVSTLNAGTMT